jgi:hypothetical protein
MLAGTIEIEVTNDFLAADGARAGFVVLAGFLLSFLFIRTSARLMRSPRVSWWPGSVETGDLHIHHLVWGIVLVLLSGFLGFALQPESAWVEVLAALFGVGTGLTLDEFALWLRLEDVYWADEGRESLEAVCVATIIGAMVVLGVAPFETGDASGSAVVFGATVLVNIAFAGVAVLKGKTTLAVLGAFVPFVAQVAAIRLAKPSSPWAKRRYPPGSEKLRRATGRGGRWEARRDRWMNRLGGAPSEVAEQGSERS